MVQIHPGALVSAARSKRRKRRAEGEFTSPLAARYGVVAQFGRASEWHSAGPGFDPPRLHPDRTYSVMPDRVHGSMSPKNVEPVILAPSAGGVGKPAALHT